MNTAERRVLVRPQRGSYARAMLEMIEVTATIEALQQHIGTDLPVVVQPYLSGFNKRNGWDTHLILVDGLPWGFASGPVPSCPSSSLVVQRLPADDTEGGAP
ncbi:hypothetical protein [Paracidovorax avenae]|uniref:hypothetical protein n=1 Tax=Paracidovorax avenae TaxID=80867 RepID=UPI001AD82606|nr:hypothetical protein [Paracidovorax avenae]